MRGDNWAGKQITKPKAHRGIGFGEEFRISLGWGIRGFGVTPAEELFGTGPDAGSQMENARLTIDSKEGTSWGSNSRRR